MFRGLFTLISSNWWSGLGLCSQRHALKLLVDYFILTVFLLFANIASIVVNCLIVNVSVLRFFCICFHIGMVALLSVRVFYPTFLFFSMFPFLFFMRSVIFVIIIHPVLVGTGFGIA